MRNSPDTRRTTTPLPSFSSSVSSASSLSAATTPNHNLLHIHRHHRRPAQPPQRSASAGAVMRHPQHQNIRHSTPAANTTTPLRPASWGNERSMSFNHHVDDPSCHPHPSLLTALLQQQQQQDRWDDSQLAMELAEDDLIDETVKRRSSARRIKQRLMNSISRQSLDLNNPYGDDLAASSSTSSGVIVPSSSGNRIARSLKKLTAILF